MTKGRRKIFFDFFYNLLMIFHRKGTCPSIPGVNQPTSLAAGS